MTAKESCSEITSLVTGIQANGATISPDPSVARDYSQPVQFTLTAPDGTKTVFTVTVKGNVCASSPTPTQTPDTTPPTITLLGTNPLSLTIGTAYTEAGATCVDNKDPSCTVVTTGTVNTVTVGTYTITYTATDAAGNVSSTTRTVNVVAAADPAPITGGAFAALVDMTVGDYGGNPFIGGAPSIIINAGGVTDPLGRTIVYTATGLPTGLTIDSSTGVISGTYDSNAGGGLIETFNVTIKAQAIGSVQFITKTFILSIRDDG